MSPEDHLKLENQICFPLYVTSRLLTRAYQPLLAELGITYPQYLVLLVLWEQDGLKVSAISEKLFLNSNTLTPLLKRMEQLNLLTRVRSKEDERQVDITLTEKGKLMQKSAKCIPENLLKTIKLPAEELIQFKATLHKLLTTLEEADKE
ncbi:MarR family transcriptional regulator [Echinicola sp. CAU 1574]|uniref:HTH-type transcriptional regulator SarZ n=1 Tax=Echinicola arenosa TaxID=2774144 RepID=A0ABR9AJ55_9BACT|nr:MarR family transcriptional regulator [Echinicola arenosa]MBD8488864.1 MarR family transcriptional regulator [Echinicola arenosa]